MKVLGAKKKDFINNFALWVLERVHGPDRFICVITLKAGIFAGDLCQGGRVLEPL